MAAASASGKVTGTKKPGRLAMLTWYVHGARIALPQFVEHSKSVHAGFGYGGAGIIVLSYVIRAIVPEQATVTLKALDDVLRWDGWVAIGLGFLLFAVLYSMLKGNWLGYVGLEHSVVERENTIGARDAELRAISEAQPRLSWPLQVGPDFNEQFDVWVLSFSNATKPPRARTAEKVTAGIELIEKGEAVSHWRPMWLVPEDPNDVGPLDKNTQAIDIAPGYGLVKLPVAFRVKATGDCYAWVSWKYVEAPAAQFKLPNGAHQLKLKLLGPNYAADYDLVLWTAPDRFELGVVRPDVQ